MNEEFNVDEAQVGRILHFVIDGIDGRGGLHCRPSIVVEDWPGQGKPGYVNLVVFTDGKNDGRYGTDTEYPTGLAILNRWETSVNPNHAVRAIRTWHWPRECHNLHSPAEPTKFKGGTYHHNHAEGVVDEHNCHACKVNNAPVTD